MTRLQSNIVTVPEGKEREWLDDIFTQATRARETHEAFAPVLINMTPVLAALLLTHNTWNRTLREGAVANLITEVSGDRWVYTSQPVIFDWDSILADGQHRLTTIVRSGVTVVVSVSFGLDPRVRLLVDSQKPRSAGDAIHLVHRVSNANEVAATAGYLWAWETRNEIPTNSGRKATRGQKIEYAGEQLSRIETALATVPKSNVASRSILATMRAYLTQRTSPDLVDQFIRTINTGLNLQEGDPILVARNWLLNDTKRDLKEPNKTFDLLVQTWNAWRRGDSWKRRPTLRGTLHSVEA